MGTKIKVAPTELSHAADAVGLLIDDHRRVARLFAEFDRVKDEGDDAEKSRVVGHICRELTVHAELEEELFYPAVRKAIDDDELMDEAWVEQAGAKHLIAQLNDADPQDDLYNAKVTVLAEYIAHHVQEEEKDMFPQARASDIDTVVLGAQLLARKAELLAALQGPGGEASHQKPPRASPKHGH